MAADANIPVVEVNTETTSTDYVSYIGSNDSEAGEMMGDYVMEQLGEDGGQFAILEGEMGQSAQLLRYQGLEDTILKNDKFECVVHCLQAGSVIRQCLLRKTCLENIRI